MEGLELKQLRQLVRQGEGFQLEFKLKTNHPEKIMKEVVAFANSEGGKLLIGISDNKEIKGVKYADEDEFIISKSIEKYIFPEIDYSLEKIRIEKDREVLIYSIKKSEKKPHFLNLTGNIEESKVYVRNEDKSIQASKEVREILKGHSKSKGYKFAYGEKENILFKYLDQNDGITISKFAEIATIPKKMASRTLILLVLANVLKVVANEIEDVFCLI